MPIVSIDNPFDDAAHQFQRGAGGHRQADLFFGEAGHAIANEALLERFCAHVQAAHRSVLATGDQPRRPARAWVVAAPGPGFGKTHFMHRLAERLESEAYSVIMEQPAALPADEVAPWLLDGVVESLREPDALPRGIAVPHQGAARPACVLRLTRWQTFARAVLGRLAEWAAASAARGEGRSDYGDARATDHPPSEQYLARAAAELEARGIRLSGGAAAWITALSTLAHGTAGDDVDTALAWIAALPAEREEGEDAGVPAAPATRDATQAQARLEDLSNLATLALPIVLCVEAAPVDRRRRAALSAAPTPASAQAGSGDAGPDDDPVARMFADVVPRLALMPLLVTLDQADLEARSAHWSAAARTAHRTPQFLDGLALADGWHLVDARLHAARVPQPLADAFISDGRWLAELLGPERSVAGSLGGRDFLQQCAERFAALELPNAPREPGTEASSLADADLPAAAVSDDEEAGATGDSLLACLDDVWEAALEEAEARDVTDDTLSASLHQLLPDLMAMHPAGFAAEAPTQEGHMVFQSAQGHYEICARPPASRQETGLLARRALRDAGATVVVCFCVERGTPVPNPAWPVAASMLARAIDAGSLQVICLTHDQAVQIAAAALLKDKLGARLDGESFGQAWRWIGERLDWCCDALLESAVPVD